MSRKNIRQNYFDQIRKVTEEVGKAGEHGKNFRCIIFMGDASTNQGFSFLHASDGDLRQFLLQAMRNSYAFAYAATCAFEAYNKELREKQEQNKDKEDKEDEEDNN